MFPDLKQVLPPGWQAEMAATPQNPKWHGEGDVLTHTKLVFQALAQVEAYQRADESTRQILSLAALLHDIGKIRTTRLEDGSWVSPGHGRVGAQMARQMLWQELGLCGTPEKQRIRETVCQLIRYHGVPPYAITREDGVVALRKIAANGALLPGFTIDLLCTLAEADARGRICDDRAEMLEQIQLCRELARESGCHDAPFPFPDAHTGHAYLSGMQIPPEYPLYNNTWGTVILMAGLPGTGKDTWIQSNCPQLPMISLDELRREMGIAPTGNQTPVVEAARERAKVLLRKKQPFVWNATNVSPLVRRKQIDLFAAYGASAQIIYLETGWAEQLRRNQNRPDAVPEPAIGRMMSHLEPPERWEAPLVCWHCI